MIYTSGVIICLQVQEYNFILLFPQMSTMPGLPTRPCFYDIDLDPVTEQVKGLFWERHPNSGRSTAFIFLFQLGGGCLSLICTFKRLSGVYLGPSFFENFTQFGGIFHNVHFITWVSHLLNGGRHFAGVHWWCSLKVPFRFPDSVSLAWGGAGSAIVPLSGMEKVSLKKSCHVSRLKRNNLIHLWCYSHVAVCCCHYLDIRGDVSQLVPELCFVFSCFFSWLLSSLSNGSKHFRNTNLSS